MSVGKGSNEDLNVAGTPRLDKDKVFAYIQTLVDANVKADEGQPIGEIMKRRLEAFENSPVPVASLLGEKLDTVIASDASTPNGHITVFQVKGVETGKDHFSISFTENADDEKSLATDQMKQVFATTLTVFLHQGQDVDRSLGERWEQITGSKMNVNCSKCDAVFDNHADAIHHEIGEHDYRHDTRPRIGEATPEALDAALASL